jgi:allophanate hydrolase subunit 1
VRDLVEELFVLAIHACGRYHHAMHRAPAGDNAELLDLGDVTAEDLHAAARAMRAEAGVLTVIPGHSSLYVIRGASPGDFERVTREPRELRVPVVFDGADLPELLSRVSREELLRRVADLRLTARYLGFRGGFAYLDGWPEEWAMPRRPTSRPVKRGAFAVAGSVAGFYPIDTPGGWNLLGRTGLDLEHALVPGDVIAIEPVEELPAVTSVRPAAPPLRRAELVQSPLATVVQPPDYANLQRGLPAGGPFDDLAAAIAMRAVRGDVELLECAMAGPRLRFREDAVLAWCMPDLGVEPRRVRAGEEVAYGRINGGLRAYLAIGDEEGATARVERGDRKVILAVRGPHDAGLQEVECEVTPQLDRVGIRLRPLTPLAIPIPADLRSVGMQCGTVQLHPDGSLVAMGPDHPVTGGYLQPMTVITSERWKLAQLSPGERVRFEVS